MVQDEPPLRPIQNQQIGNLVLEEMRNSYSSDGGEIQPSEDAATTRRAISDQNFQKWRQTQIDDGGYRGGKDHEKVNEAAEKVRSRGKRKKKERLSQRYNFHEAVHPSRR